GQHGVNSGAVDGSTPAVRVDLGLWTGTEQAAQAPVLGELLQLRALRLQLVAARDRADGLQRGGELVPGNARGLGWCDAAQERGRAEILAKPEEAGGVLGTQGGGGAALAEPVDPLGSGLPVETHVDELVDERINALSRDFLAVDVHAEHPINARVGRPGEMRRGEWRRRGENDGEM